MSVSADNEWSPLRSVIVGRAAGSCFPNEPRRMIEATMPPEHHDKFYQSAPFPAHIVERAGQELHVLARILQQQGIAVARPKVVQWLHHQGYTSAMPRDGLMTVGNTIIEACFAWRSRAQEISLSYLKILDDLAMDPSVTVVRAPMVQHPNTIYHEIVGDEHQQAGWAINNSRPAFDTADFMRFGKTILGQLSHVTNPKGVEYLRSHIPEGYSVELLETTDPSAMHIDATILPLREGLLVYQPGRVTEEALRKHAVFADWTLLEYPILLRPRVLPPLFMTTPWLAINLLVLDGKRVLVEEHDVVLAEWLEELGMEPVMVAFRNVQSLGGSFHCATVDLVRDG